LKDPAALAFVEVGAAGEQAQGEGGGKGQWPKDAFHGEK
jgi:hypothetical protein